MHVQNNVQLPKINRGAYIREMEGKGEADQENNKNRFQMSHGSVDQQVFNLNSPKKIFSPVHHCHPAEGGSYPVAGEGGLISRFLLVLNLQVDGPMTAEAYKQGRL